MVDILLYIPQEKNTIGPIVEDLATSLLSIQEEMKLQLQKA